MSRSAGLVSVLEALSGLSSGSVCQIVMIGYALDSRMVSLYQPDEAIAGGFAGGGEIHWYVMEN